MVFNDEQKRLMLEMYFRNGRKVNGEWIYSVQDALEEFRETYPNVVANFNAFRKCIDHLVELYRATGSITRKEGSGRPRIRTEENIEAVRHVMDEQPQTSIRHLHQQVNLSYSTCQRILKQDLHLHPYRLQAFHEILPTDRPRRLEFCQWFLHTFENNDEALEKTFFTDEAYFHLSGYINSQNMRMWSADNPHFFTESPLHPQKIGVWAALSKRRIIGPIFFEGILNGERYRLEILSPFMQMLHDDELRYGHFQQDGARIHTTRDNLDFIMEFFDHRIISQNMPIVWPPRSCDLTPCDFFLWPYLKNSIFATPVGDMEDLKDRISNKIEEINNTPVLLANVVNSINKRVRLCMDEDGGHITQLL